jgi:lipopolysaccharide/colanic/teichoic acid biosynthesis glycosyltransferase
VRSALAKRTVDLVGAALGLALLWPVLGAVALVVRAADGGPVFFRQVRVGRDGRRFRIWKFRTMVVGAERIGGPLTVGADARITAPGRWLRRHRLDELPQLFNVLAGEMSLVGPRPEVERYVARYGAAERAVLALAPGITDPATLRFLDEAELLACAADPERAYVEAVLPEKIRLNLAYAARASVATDLAVVAATLRRLVAPARRRTPAARVLTPEGT